MRKNKKIKEKNRSFKELIFSLVFLTLFLTKKYEKNYKMRDKYFSLIGREFAKEALFNCFKFILNYETSGNLALF